MQMFVRLRIRFISLNNGIDTVYDNMNAATTSVNVRGTLNCNRKQGKFIGSFPSYGYLKDSNDYHKLIIPNPSMYKQLKGWNYKHPTGKNTVRM